MDLVLCRHVLAVAAEKQFQAHLIPKVERRKFSDDWSGRDSKLNKLSPWLLFFLPDLESMNHVVLLIVSVPEAAQANMVPWEKIFFTLAF